MCFFIIFNSLFNGRQVVKDTKVKARYHHLIANSFVEVSFSQKEGFVAFGSEGDSLETKVVKPFFFKTHLKCSSPIFVSRNTKNKCNKYSTHSSAKEHLTCLPCTLTAHYWMCSAIPRNHLNCLTATVPCITLVKGFFRAET